MYQTKIKAVGKEADAFHADQMLILFGENAPDELADYCYIIDTPAVKENITEEHILYIDKTPYQITTVGALVNKNLNELGHITLKFDGSKTAEQAGTLYLEKKAFTDIKVGSIITIV